MGGPYVSLVRFSVPSYSATRYPKDSAQQTLTEKYSFKDCLHVSSIKVSHEKRHVSKVTETSCMGSLVGWLE